MTVVVRDVVVVRKHHAWYLYSSSWGISRERFSRALTHVNSPSPRISMHGSHLSLFLGVMRSSASPILLTWGNSLTPNFPDVCENNCYCIPPES